MKSYRVRITRVQRVVQQADVQVQAESWADAQEAAAEVEVNGWVTIDGETMDQTERVMYEEESEVTDG